MTTPAREWTARLAGLLTNERAALADFLVALAEFDRQRLWIDMGYTSLFWFLHRELGLSKGAAFYRKTAAELAQDYPEIVEPLRDGRLCLSSVVELSKVITPDNRARVLPEFFGTSKQEAKEVSAALLPVESPPRRAVVTAVCTPAASSAMVASRPRSDDPRVTAATAATAATAQQTEPGSVGMVHPENLPRANSSVPDVTPAPKPARSPWLEVEPLTADLRRLHVTVSRQMLDKLEAARAALSHSHPGAAADEILEAGLDLLLERAAKRRGLLAKPPKRAPDPQPPSPATPPPTSSPPTSSPPTPPASPTGRIGHRARPDRYVPADVRRAVWERDKGRCQFPLVSGGLCGSTHQLEIDHVVPVALGGQSTLDNCRLVCRPHNDLAARQAFGERWMDRFTKGRGRQRRSRS